MTISLSDLIVEKIRKITREKAEHNRQCERCGRGVRIMQVATFNEITKRMNASTTDEERVIDRALLSLVKSGQVRVMSRGFYLFP
jgi:hypothetical protein